MTELLVDTAKIRTFKFFSNSSKNGGSLNVLLFQEVFIFSPTVMEWINLDTWWVDSFQL